MNQRALARAAVLAAVLSGAGGLAMAQSSGKGHGMNDTEVASRIEAAGYTHVHGVEREGSHFEAEAATRDGKPIHLHVDATTGKITQVAHESEEEEREERRPSP